MRTGVGLPANKEQNIPALSNLIAITITAPKTNNQDIDIQQFGYLTVLIYKKGVPLPSFKEGKINTSSGLHETTTSFLKANWFLDARFRYDKNQVGNLNRYYTQGFTTYRPRNGDTLVAYDEPGFPTPFVQPETQDPQVEQIKYVAAYIDYVVVDGWIYGAPIYWNITYVATRANRFNPGKGTYEVGYDIANDKTLWLTPSKQEEQAAVDDWAKT